MNFKNPFTVTFSDELQKKRWNKIYHLIYNLFTHYLVKMECIASQLLIHIRQNVFS